MKTAILTVAGLAAAASAQSFVADLSGVGVDGAAPTIIAANNSNSGALTTIDFDISVTTASPSWGSEVNIQLVHLPSGFTFTADGDDADFSDDGPADFLFGWGNSVGTFSFSGSVDLTGQLADVNGAWEIRLSDDFDDFANPDHSYDAGSTVTINNVPAPAGLAILGLGGLAAARRRR
jgi:hypothetical protein